MSVFTKISTTDKVLIKLYNLSALYDCHVEFNGK
jgi:hypothetical protein